MKGFDFMFKIIAGDFVGISKYSTVGNRKVLIAGITGNDSRVEQIDIKGNIDKIEVVTEETKKKFIGAAGWGLVGAAALGPLGLIAGVLSGGNKKEICFVCYLKDGRKFMAISDSKVYQDFVSAQFEKPDPIKSPGKYDNLKAGIILAVIGLVVLKLFF